MTKGVSLASLNVRNNPAAEFEYITPAGQRTGLFFSILGSHSASVVAVSNQMVNDRRREESAKAAAAALDRRADNYTPIETDIEFAQRLASIRLTGWRGIDDTFSPENALVLCQTNPDISSWILDRSNAMGFTSGTSPKGS